MKRLSRAVAIALLAAPVTARPAMAQPAPAPAADFSVGPQYDSTHVYVAPADFDRFIASFVATFGLDVPAIS